MTCEFPTQRASNAENVSIWWRHYDRPKCSVCWCQIWEYSSCHLLSLVRKPLGYWTMVIMILFYESHLSNYNSTNFVCLYQLWIDVLEIKLETRNCTYLIELKIIWVWFWKWPQCINQSRTKDASIYAIMQTNGGCRWDLGNKRRWNLIQSTIIFIQEHKLGNVTCRISSIMSRPQCFNKSIDMHRNPLLWFQWL